MCQNITIPFVVTDKHLVAQLLGAYVLVQSAPSQVAVVVKNMFTNAVDKGSIPGLGRSPGKGHSNPLQYSCLENPMDRGAWGAKVLRVAKSWT